VLNASGGPGLITEYLGPASGGTGHITNIGGQYDLSLGTLLRHPVERFLSQYFFYRGHRTEVWRGTMTDPHVVAATRLDLETGKGKKANGTRKNLTLMARHQLFPQVYRIVDQYVETRIDTRGQPLSEIGLPMKSYAPPRRAAMVSSTRTLAVIMMTTASV
jgi:hypothetical protein